MQGNFGALFTNSQYQKYILLIGQIVGNFSSEWFVGLRIIIYKYNQMILFSLDDPIIVFNSNDWFNVTYNLFGVNSLFYITRCS